MDKSVDKFDNISGWIVDPGVTIALNAHKNLIASDHYYSILVSYPDNSFEKSIKKIYSTPVDIGGSDFLVFNFKTFRFGKGFIKKSDAAYSVIINDDQEFFFPAREIFSMIKIPVIDIAELSSIEFKSQTEYADDYVISDLRAVKDELVIDVLEAVREAIEKKITRAMGKGIAIGTVTASAGDKQVEIKTNWDWVDSEVVIRIDDGVNSELHQVADHVTQKVTFLKTFDGGLLLHDYVDARIYITAPVAIGRYDIEARLPGVMLWYTSPIPEMQTSRTSRQLLCATDTHYYLERDGLRYKWSVVIDHEARSPELINYITHAVRAFLADSKIWVHGIKYTFDWEATAVDTDPTEAWDIVPQTVYTFDLSVRESVYDIEALPYAGAANYNVEIGV